jgi:hypothetical protein
MNTKALALMAGGLVAAAGVGTAIADLGGDDDGGRSFSELELRKDDGAGDVELIDEEDDPRDGDGSGDGNGGTGDGGDRGAGPAQDAQTGSGDSTGIVTGNTAGTGWEGDTDGDLTAGNDGSGGGDNSYVAPVADSADGYVAPAPAPAPA